MVERDRPVDKSLKYYNPMEDPPRYPLELCDTDCLEICLWSEKGDSKCTIAYFQKYKEGYELKFVHLRPLDKRVNWKHFRKLVKQGQKIADKKFKKETGWE